MGGSSTALNTVGCHARTAGGHPRDRSTAMNSRRLTRSLDRRDRLRIAVLAPSVAGNCAPSGGSLTAMGPTREGLRCRTQRVRRSLSELPNLTCAEVGSPDATFRTSPSERDRKLASHERAISAASTRMPYAPFLGCPEAFQPPGGRCRHRSPTLICSGSVHDATRAHFRVEHDLNIKLIAGLDTRAKPVVRTATRLIVENGGQSLLCTTQAEPQWRQLSGTTGG
jgi:hypothetical protein